MISTDFSSSANTSSMAAAQQAKMFQQNSIDSADIESAANEQAVSLAVEQADAIAKTKDQDASNKAYEVLLSNVKEYEVRNARQADELQGNALRLEIQAYLQQEDDQRMVDEIVWLVDHIP